MLKKKSKFIYTQSCKKRKVNPESEEIYYYLLNGLLQSCNFQHAISRHKKNNNIVIKCKNNKIPEK